MSGSALFPAGRLEDAAERVRAGGLGALLLTPGPDLRYVSGYDAKQLERLTCLVIPARGEPVLVVPRLELAAAQASPASGLGLEMIAWEETEVSVHPDRPAAGPGQGSRARGPDVGPDGAAVP